MAKKRGTYDDAHVHSRWLQIMNESQTRTVYVIRGVPVSRVRYGDEAEDLGAGQRACHDCGAVKGQYHAFGQCDAEQCPACRGKATGCDCAYEGDDGDDQDVLA